jgi:hypothetical protein
MKMKPTRSKCIWTAVIAVLAVCMTVSRAGAADNLGDGYISSVTSGTNCVYSDTNNGGVQFWDIQAGGTYTVTISGVDDAANGGLDSTMQVIVHNSDPNDPNNNRNICVVANQVVVNNMGVEGEYTFTVTLTNQCMTMPIEYGTLSCNPHSPQCQPVAGCQGFGLFAKDFPNNAPPPPGDKNEGHLRTTIFDGYPSCAKQADDNMCQASPTPPPRTGSITVCKYYDKNANGFQDTGEPNLANWPFCIDPLDNGIPAQVTQLTGSGGCATWTNLTIPGDYVVTEANANETNWFHSTGGTSMIMLASGSETRYFGNYCLSPSGGLTLGFWSNKNGNKVLTGNTSGVGTTLLTAVTNLLNSPCTGGGRFVNANGQIHNFTGTYADFKNWLLGANATNMAYMLSAQMATLLLDTHYGATIGAPPVVDGNAFDLCSHMTINGLLSAACDSITGAGNQYTLSGNPSRPGQEMLKNCIDKINNNGDVIPVTPCPYTFPTPPAPCP